MKVLRPLLGKQNIEKVFKDPGVVKCIGPSEKLTTQSAAATSSQS